MRVDIWSDVVCPFCYIGKKRLEHVAAEVGIELEVIGTVMNLTQTHLQNMRTPILSA